MKKVLNQKEVSCVLSSMAKRIQEFGNENLCFIPILKGGVWVAHKLLELLPSYSQERIVLGYLGLSSYKGDLETSEKITITYPLDLKVEEMEGRNLYILDDIFDSGLTLTTAKSIIEKEIEQKGIIVSSIRTAVLVNKMKPKIELHRSVKGFPTISGFEYYDDGFLVGCGLGFGEKYRCLDELYELDPKEDLAPDSVLSSLDVELD